MLRIVLAGDSAGAGLSKLLAEYLCEKYEVDELSETPETDGELYPHLTDRVAAKVAAGEYDRGVLVCGTGIGVCISANKVPGIRAALTHDTYSAERAALSNNAQIITLGARVVGPELAKAIVDTYLSRTFDQHSHSAKNVEAIGEVESKYKASKAVVETSTG